MAVLSAAPACSSDSSASASTESRDRIDYVFGPRTKQLGDAELAALGDGADQSQTLRFDVAVGSKFTRGDVLIAGVSPKTPRGLLRVVRSATTSGGVTELETEQAPLQLAFEKLHAHVERTLPLPSQPPPPLKPRAGFEFGGVAPVSMFVFNGDGDPATVEDQLRFEDAYKGQISVKLDIDFEWGFVDAMLSGIDDFLKCALTFGLAGDCPDLDLPKLGVTMTAGMSVGAAFDHAGAASSSYEYGPFAIGDTKSFDAIYIGPLVILPELQFEGRTKGRAGSFARLAGEAETGFELTASISTDTGVKASAEATRNFRVDKVEAFLDAHVSTSSGPTLRMLAFGAIGPTFGVDFRSDLDVDRTRIADCYRASLGIDGRFGFVVRFPWRAIGKWLTKSAEIGEDLERVARYFGLAGTILDVSKSFPLLDQQVGQGACTTPPAGSLPPGAPQDDTLANPPFTPWSKRFDEPGLHYQFSAAPHNARARLVPSVDGHVWAVAAPSPTVRRIAIDGRSLSATRYLTKIDDKEVPLPVTDVLERTDLYKWVLFENGSVARLAPDNAFVDAFALAMPVADGEEATLRRGAVRADGRTALLFGIHQMTNTFDHRLVLVELSPSGSILRSRAMGEPTSEGVQSAFFITGQAIYRDDGSLVIGGEMEAGVEDLDSHCMALSVADDGSSGFATELRSSRSAGTCNFGALSVATNGDLLLAASDGGAFGSSGLVIVMDANGRVKTSSSFVLENDSLVFPTSVVRLPTSGYLVAGNDDQSAVRDGLFVIRLDGQGLPLSASGIRTPENVSVGFLDAIVTKDAGVLFGALSDWSDLADGRELTRFLAGKAFAKDGSLPFPASSGMTTVPLAAVGAATTVTGTPFARSFSDVPVTLAKVTLRAESVAPVETVFAP